MSVWRFKIVCVAVPLPAVIEAVHPARANPARLTRRSRHLSGITDQGKARVFDGSGLAA